VKLSSAGFLEGLQRGKPTVDMAQIETLRRGHHRAHRLPRLAAVLARSPTGGSTRVVRTSIS
jgi:hypothetical protein